MSLFQRLIHKSGARRSTKRTSKIAYDSEKADDFCCSPLPFAKEQLRLVIYLQQSEKRLIFDSSTVRPRRVSESSTSSDPDFPVPPRVYVTADGKFECHPPLPDTKVLEDMIFGSTAMAYKGQLTKVHQNDDPDQIVLSRVVACSKSCLPRSNSSFGSRLSSSESGSDSQYSSVSSKDGFTRLDLPGRSIPMDVPSEIQKTASLNRHSTPRTPRNTPERPLSSNSLSPRASTGSLSRSWRVKLAKQKRRDKNLSACDEDVTTIDSNRLLGFGLVVEKGKCSQSTVTFEYFRKFLFTHMHLIEGGLEQLQENILLAYINNRKKGGSSVLFERVTQAWVQFQVSIMQMYMAPRLREPVWLELMVSNGVNQPLSHKFGTIFTALAELTDTKHTNFFLSTLLTAVLTQHVSWVASVAPCSTPTEPVNKLGGVAADDAMSKSATSLSLAPEHQTPCQSISDLPYNPYWAQYNDVTGTLSTPVRAAKTLVVGDDAHLVSQILFALSYFVRCSILKQTPHNINTDVLDARFSSEEQFTISRSPSLDEMKENEPVEMEGELHPKIVKPVFDLTCRNRSGSFETPSCSQRQTAFTGRSRNNSLPLQKRPLAVWKDWKTSGDPYFVSPSETPCPASPQDPLPVPLCERVSLPVDPLQPVDSSPEPSAYHVCRIPNFVKRRQNSLDVQFIHLMTVGPLPTRPVPPPPVIHTSPSSPVLRRSHPLREDSLDSNAENQLTQPPKVQKNSVDSGIEEGDTSHVGGRRNSATRADQPQLAPRRRSLAERRHSATSHRASKASVHELMFCSANCDELTALRSPCDESSSAMQHSLHTDCSMQTSVSSSTYTDCEKSWAEETTPAYLKDLGRSLLCGWQPVGYSPYAVLSGVKPSTDLYAHVSDELKWARQTRLQACPDAEATCIVADTTDWTVKVLSSNSDDYTLNDSKMTLPSALVAKMIEGAKSLVEMTHAPDFCLSYLEDQLLEMYFKSESLMELLEASDEAVVQTDTLSSLIDCQMSDIPLLLSVATIHSPHVLKTLNVIT